MTTAWCLVVLIMWSILYLFIYLFIFSREEHPRQHGFAQSLEGKNELDFFRHLRVTKATSKLNLENMSRAVPLVGELYFGPKISLPDSVVPWEHCNIQRIARVIWILRVISS